MTLANSDELLDVLRSSDRLGLVFARHAYGMRAWVDLFSLRVAEADDAETKALLATLVADNARHMMLFRARAAAHGIDPDAYEPPGEGHAIYERIPRLSGTPQLAGYALGSLDHFRELLGVYARVADGDDALAIAQVIADVERMQAALRPLAGASGAAVATEAHELYRLRELAETPRYADAA
ncbi:MAG TPA: hypothetical protein VF257_09290 [Solirubrobacteraceae bacterium]